jgi:hypothetical protein
MKERFLRICNEMKLCNPNEFSSGKQEADLYRSLLKILFLEIDVLPYSDLKNYYAFLREGAFQTFQEFLENQKG